jgi:excisionase family DNA binding protein
MRDRFYSTADLARVCGVSISTIKRWTDAGLLRCVRTPGGHRKFRVQDVAEAARRLGLGAADPEGAGGARLDELALLLLQGNTTALAAHVQQALLDGDADGARGVLHDLHRHGLTLVQLADLLAGAVAALRLRAQAGDLDDFVLRRAEQVAAGTARALAEACAPPPVDAPCALLGGAAGARAPLAAALAQLVLAEQGWRSVDLGAELTGSILRGGLHRVRPELVVLLHGGREDEMERLADEVTAGGVDLVRLEAARPGALVGLRTRLATHARRLTESMV